MADPIRKVDAIGIPSSDLERSREFYVDTLGLQPDENERYEFWIDQTCFEIWDPAQLGGECEPQTTSVGQEFAPSPAGIAIRVPDVAAARAELQTKGVEFDGEIVHTSVCDMTFFKDPDGNALILHRRFAPFPDGRMP